MAGASPAFATYRYFGTYRLVLATMVMFQHYAANAAPIQVTRFFLPLEIGSLAVLAFFCLSGFVIIEAADTVYRGRSVAFMVNRLLRVFPHFLVALSLSIGLHWVAIANGTLHLERTSDAIPPMTVFAPLNIVANYLSIIPPFELLASYNFISIAWAVRIEMAFYVVVALCLFVTSKTKVSFVTAALLMVLVLAPLFAMAVLGKGPLTFGFLPYFVFGGALYYAVKGKRSAILVLVASIATMAWHFLAQPWQHPAFGYLRDVPSQFVILFGMIAVLVLLAMVRGRRYQREDSRAGSITYPLYMYHLVILIPVTSLFADYTYPTFIAGMIGSVVFSALMARILDPMVDSLRDRIRGQRLAVSIPDHTSVRAPAPDLTGKS